MFNFKVSNDTLVISFDAPRRALSWAVLNGGMCDVRHIINHHVKRGHYDCLTYPKRYLQAVAEQLELVGPVVGMMTGADVTRFSLVHKSYKNLTSVCFVTAGCTNTLCVGDPTDFVEQDTGALGTINIAVLSNCRLSDEAMVEAVQITTEAKVKALYETKLKSKITGELATGTGTDCIVIASGGETTVRYCGKHTKVGELIGAAVLESVRAALLKKSFLSAGRESRGILYETI